MAAKTSRAGNPDWDHKCKYERKKMKMLSWIYVIMFINTALSLSCETSLFCVLVLTWGCNSYSGFASFIRFHLKAVLSVYLCWLHWNYVLISLLLSNKRFLDFHSLFKQSKKYLILWVDISRVSLFEGQNQFSLTQCLKFLSMGTDQTPIAQTKLGIT